MRQWNSLHRGIDMLQDALPHRIMSTGTLGLCTIFLILTCAANPASLSSYTKDSKGTNLLSTTANQAPGHGVQTSVHDRVHNASSMTPLAPRSLSWKNPNGSWNLLFNDWEAFPPSSASTYFPSPCFLFWTKVEY